MAQSFRYRATKLGGPTEVAKVTRPTIESDNEVLVQVHAVSLQPLDHKMIDEGMRVQHWPCAPGMNAAGVVSEVGKGVTRFKPGDEVLGYFMPGDDRKAAFQEYAIAGELDLAKKHPRMSFEDASSLPIAYITALGSVYAALEITVPWMPSPPGGGFKPQSILVLGGSSAVGASAIQLLRLALPGAVILTTCSTKHHDRMVQELGANKAFDRDAPLDDIRAATPTRDGVDAILGAVEGAVDRPEILDALRPDGDKKFAEVMSGRDTKVVPEGVKLIVAHGFSVWGKPGVMDGLASMLEEGRFKLPSEVSVVGKGFEALDSALEQMRKGVSGRKIVVSF